MNPDDYIFDISTCNSDITITYDTSTISSMGNTIDISTLTDNNISFNWDDISIAATLWEDTLPAIDTVKDMCVEYPALEKAYENFKTIYKMVEQDWIGKQKEQDS